MSPLQNKYEKTNRIMFYATIFAYLQHLTYIVLCSIFVFIQIVGITDFSKIIY